MRMKSDKKDANSILHRKKALLGALKAEFGNITKACERVKIARITYYSYLKDSNFLSQVEAISEANIDFAEGQLIELIKGVELTETKVFCNNGKITTQDVIKKYTPDTTAIIFYLKTKGRTRGYIEHQDLNLNQPVEFVVKPTTKKLLDAVDFNQNN